MHFEVNVEVEAPVEATWAALTQVENWPRWTASMEDVRWLNDAGVGLGARARVKQPGMPPLVWTVSEFEEGRAFSWVTRTPGVRTVGVHRVRALGATRSQLSLHIEQTGVFAPLAEMLMGARTRRFVMLEGEGLKRAAEAAVPNERAAPAKSA